MRRFFLHMGITIKLMFVMLFALPAQAEMIGTITNLKGDVLLQRHNSEVPAPIKIDTEIFIGDQIETLNDQSAVEITFIDNTNIFISGERGALIIDEYVFDPEVAEQGRARFSLINATFRYIGGILSKTNNADVQVELAFGSIGIRGTKFWRTMSDKQCWIYLEEGAISVFNEAGEQILVPGQGTRLTDKQIAPENAQMWDPGRVSWIKQTVKAQ